MQIVNRYIKKSKDTCSISLLIREIQIQITVSNHLSMPVTMAISERQKMATIGKMQEKETNTWPLLVRM